MEARHSSSLLVVFASEAEEDEDADEVRLREEGLCVPLTKARAVMDAGE